MCAAVLAAIAPASVFAQDQDGTDPAPPAPPPALTCDNLTIPVTAVPDGTPLTFTIPMDDLANRCISVTDDPLTVVTPSAPITVSPAPNSSQSFSFTVSDSHGNTATASVTVTRD